MATVSPEDATDKSVSWTSSADGVATVVDGFVTAVAAGTATITVTTTDGGHTATCDITVNPEPKVLAFYLHYNSWADTMMMTQDMVIDLKETGAVMNIRAETQPYPLYVLGQKCLFIVSGAIENSRQEGGAPYYAFGDASGVPNDQTFVVGDYTVKGIIVKNNVGVNTDTLIIDFKVVDTSTGMENHEADGFRLYPNPVSGGTLFLEITDPGITDFEIYNTVGVMIHKENVNTRTLIELNTPAIRESGLYFVRMIKEQSSTVEQFIVQ